MKYLIGGLILTLILINPIKVLAYATTPEKAVAQDCTTINSVVQFINQHNQCSNEDRVQYLVHICAGESINGKTINESNFLAATMLCPDAIGIVEQDNQRGQYNIKDDTITGYFGSTTATNNLSITLKSLTDSAESGMKSVFNFIVWLLTVHINWQIIKAILYTLGMITGLFLLAYWLGGGK